MKYYIWSTTELLFWTTAIIFHLKLNSIKFADDANLFHDPKSIIKHFASVNEELMNTSKLSPDVGKTKYSLFHKLSRVDDLPLKLPKISINNQEIKRASCTKFLILLDENLSWKEHLKYTENEITRSTGLTYKAKPFLDKDSLVSLYFPYIHSYINHANLALAGTHKTNLKKIHSQQKHALRIVYK